MREAKVGRRVGNRFGEEGTVLEVNRNEVFVEWDDGFRCWTLADRLHPVPKRVAGFSWAGWLAIGMLGFIALSIIIFAR